MSSGSLFQRLRSRFRRRKDTASHQGFHPSAGGDLALATLQMMPATREEEYSCDQAYELMDQYAEMVRRGENVSALLPLVYHHFEMCPECREELVALIRILEAGALPSAALFTA
jgi:hypothetical protein